ncbi:MAG: hypothetical protein ACLPN2_11345 [Terriglobales bacterium]
MTQANRPFEHDARLKELLARQAKLNGALDLDKSDAQAAEPVEAAVESVATPLGRESIKARTVNCNSSPAPRL